jgi:hypothetical protein
VRNVTSTGDDHLAARDLSGLDVAATEVLVDAGQTVGVESRGIGVNLHRVIIARNRFA